MEAGSHRPLRIAAAGDVHAHHSRPEATIDAFARLPEVDAVLLAGDLTAHGEPEEGEILAEACRPHAGRVYAVLGNHDWHLRQEQEIAAALTDAGVRVLEREACVHEADGREIGIAGVKGFIGGFVGSHLPDYGEPLLREVYAETSRDVEALERGLREIETCDVRVALLHYAPTEATVEGEPPGIRAFLGNDRLAAPILQHQPDLVLHGHAHAGSFEAAIGESSVFNVSVPVIDRSFWVFEVGEEAAGPRR